MHAKGMLKHLCHHAPVIQMKLALQEMQESTGEATADYLESEDRVCNERYTKEFLLDRCSCD